MGQQERSATDHAPDAPRGGEPGGAAIDGGPVFAQHHSPMLLVDPEDQRIVAANPAAVRFYGWSEQELTGMFISDVNVLPPAEIAREVAAARREERAYFALRHRTADGAVHDVELYSNQIEIDGRALLATIVHEGGERHRAIHALHTSEAFARAIVDFAPVGIAVADLQGRIVRANAAMAAITGREVGTLMGRDYRELTAPEDRGRSREVATELHAQQRDAYHVEKRYLRPDGTTVEVDAWSMLVRDGQGEPSFQLGVVRDLSEERLASRAAEQAAARLALTMDAVQDAIFIVTPDWRVSYVNRRFEELLGVPAAAVIDQDLWESFPAALGGGFERAYRKAFTTGEPQTVREHYPPTGQWYEARAYPSSEGLVVYFSDVTDREEHQARLERIAAIERANADRYRQLDETKTAFLTAVSHELRTPLTVVSGLAETLVRLREALDGDVRARLEDGVLHHSQRLTRLLDELLDIDRLSRGTLQMEREEIDLAAAVRATVAASAVAHRCHLQLPERDLAWVDAVQFDHLLANLLSNVDKYAPEGPVEVALEAPAADRVRLRVADSGPGIPAEQRGRVFEPFVRLHDDHPQPGTGVGLTLVAEFARLHGGQAWVEGGAGATVVIELLRGGPDSGDGEVADAPGDDGV